MRIDNNLCKPVAISIEKLHPFEGHPYKVLDNEEMEALTESVQTEGIRPERDRGLTMGRNAQFLQKAEALKPALNRRTVYGRSMDAAADFRSESYCAGAVIRLDFGNHMVGKLTLKLGYTGSHPDAPAWLRLKFAERECELSEDAESYHGWISKGWIQQEQLHVDVLPAQLELPRRYAFRYLQIEVLDVSSKYRLRIEDAWCTAETSANEERLADFHGTPRQEQLDRIAVHTLRECMQEVFEDGPKRDRRLWLGDLRMQALANYQTFRCSDLVNAASTCLRGQRWRLGESVPACLRNRRSRWMIRSCLTIPCSLFRRC